MIQSRTRSARFLFILLAGTTLIFYGCDDEGGPPDPEISSISPTSGPPGATVTIDGTGFSEESSENKVTFGGTRADVTSASTSSLQATVPEEATTGAVEVFVRGELAVGPNFTVEEQAPGISAVEPDSGKVGTEVTIRGMNFSPTPAENIVTFNGGVVSGVKEATDTSLVTDIPSGAASGPILVEVEGQKTQSPSFEVIPQTGELEVSATTTGLLQDADGYTVTLDSTGEQRGLDPQGNALFEDVDAGDRQLKISDVADNCSVGGANPRTIPVSGGETATTTFDVTCIGQIAFRSARTGDSEIWVMNADGSNQTNLTEDPDPDDEPRWSPDGTQIGFRSSRTGDTEIWGMRSDGANQINLTTHSALDQNARWSPDGTKMAFESQRTTDWEIFVMDADGSNPTNLTNDSGTDFEARWSPDGTQIAFRSGRSGDAEIWVMDADGSNQTNLTNDSGFDQNARWSPDGTQIAFRSGRSGDAEIWVMDADGSNPTNLTNDSGTDWEARWSPDGAKIAFLSNRTGDREIFVMDADGSNPTNLTNHSASDRTPRWSPDGTKIAFRSRRTGDGEIFVMDADGSNPINLTNHPSLDADPRWRPEE